MPSWPIYWKGCRVTVMGLGSFGGGVGLARYLAEQEASVTVTDLKDAAALRDALAALQGLPIRFVLGEHRDDDFIDTDRVFVNPAVPLTSPYLQLARSHGVPLDSELNLFVRQCAGRVVGITGSVGKTTTTSLLGSILQIHDARTLVGGNIGGSLLSRLPDIEPDIPVVLEISSFQLEHLDWLGYSPPLAVVLNLASNHLDRHGTMTAYQAAKEVILAHQTPADAAILNWDDATVRSMAARGRGRRVFYSVHAPLEAGVYRDGNALAMASDGERRVLCHDSDLRLRGLHNLGNAAAAAAAAATFGVPPATIARGLRAFAGLPHRLEWIADKGGVAYYNDSKATTPFSTQCALQAFGQPVLLLAGGYDKGTPFDDLARVMQSCVRVALLYGNTAPKLAAALDQMPAPPDIVQLPTLAAALHRAATLARRGDVVLLSPACASYDQFPHYEARGEHFRALVAELP
jgi:UDP-N-acetylmuramoylalanine--D-glutamate ligase